MATNQEPQHTLQDCAGCTDRRSEGTHSMHTKQHPCPEGGDPNCGLCFPQHTEKGVEEKKINLPKDKEARRCVLIVIEKHIGVPLRYDGDTVIVAPYAGYVAQAEERGAQRERERYQPIFDWLFGMNGDFPNLSEPPHYRFRTELQKRLTALEHPEGKQDLPDQAS